MRDRKAPREAERTALSYRRIFLEAGGVDIPIPPSKRAAPYPAGLE
ncbi:hypothetical protein OQJ59_12835 [Microbulbifer thermotolerans]|nr:hypothetical protein [Microbulbifer thermotolerans]MCX2842505.1 hypothetical protein [Microbulbifer thermotolerans]